MIVEDEPLSRLYLSSLLAEAFPDVQIISTAVAEVEAAAAILEMHPDLVFMDIELQTGSGFGVVSRLDATDTHIIFTTALDEHATNLLRLSGVPYIQKPIDLASLSLAVQAARDSGNRPHHATALGHLRTTLRNNGMPQCMLVAGIGDPVYIKLQDIISIEAEGKESRIRRHSGADIITGLELKELDDLLKGFGFFRTHMQHIINRNQVRGTLKHGQEKILMNNNIEVPVSPKKLAELRKYLAD